MDNTMNEQDTAEPVQEIKLKTRKDLQIIRRLFHMANGAIIATSYNLFLDHSHAVSLIGGFACLLYIFEQIRISYPEFSEKLLPITKFIIRAEESLKESAMVPYAFSLLLTIIIFPKVIAITAIYILAIADPLSAIIGIKYGKRRVVKHKSLEGSAAFFVTAFIVTYACFTQLYGDEYGWKIGALSFVLAIFSSIFEMLPLRLDDNMTIPISTGLLCWVLCEALGIATTAVI
jgi:dolichol kinase